jgi:hypothetical protein
VAAALHDVLRAWAVQAPRASLLTDQATEPPAEAPAADGTAPAQPHPILYRVPRDAAGSLAPAPTRLVIDLSGEDARLGVPVVVVEEDAALQRAVRMRAVAHAVAAFSPGRSAGRLGRNLSRGASTVFSRLRAGQAGEEADGGVDGHAASATAVSPAGAQPPALPARSLAPAAPLAAGSPSLLASAVRGPAGLDLLSPTAGQASTAGSSPSARNLLAGLTSPAKPGHARAGSSGSVGGGSTTGPAAASAVPAWRLGRGTLHSSRAL